MTGPADAKPRHPRGLAPLFLTEMWERFSFYLMAGILYQYLEDSQKGGMGWSGKRAASVFGTYIAVVYFTPFVGGIVADRVLGLRRTIIIGGTIMMIGHLVLAIPTEWALYLGLTCLCIGNGFFKPNISTLVGNLYPPGSPLRDAGFTIFYMGINIGALVCNFVASIARNLWGWHAAFASAGIGMAIGLATFLLTQKLFAEGDVDPKSRKEPQEPLTALWVQCVGPAVLLAVVSYLVVEVAGFDFLALGAPTTAFLFATVPVAIFYVNVWRGVKDAVERGRVAALLAIFGVVIVFWAIFQQSGTALTDWAVDDTNREPDAAVRLVSDAIPELAENAPPSYFRNAGPRTPRPHEDTFEVVTAARYRALEKARQLGVREGEKVYVTQAMLDEIYAKADRRTPKLPRGEHLQLVNAEIFQSVNPACVILFSPILVALWRWLAARKKEPSTAAKIGIGLLITALTPAIMLWAVIATNDGAIKASSWWLIWTYAMLTIGELCLSPMGLSLVSKMAPARIRAFMMGGWFLATAVGGKLSGVFGEVYHEWPHVTFYLVLIACVLAAAAAIFVLLPWLDRQMATEADG
jgi:POT family proton-dependent oligopeptide transporter